MNIEQAGGRYADTGGEKKKENEENAPFSHLGLC